MELDKLEVKLPICPTEQNNYKSNLIPCAKGNAEE